MLWFGLWECALPRFQYSTTLRTVRLSQLHGGGAHTSKRVVDRFEQRLGFGSESIGDLLWDACLALNAWSCSTYGLPSGTIVATSMT